MQRTQKSLDVEDGEIGPTELGPQSCWHCRCAGGGPSSRRVFLYPALQVEVAKDLASFDQAYPLGADYVIVPAMRDDNDLRSQPG